MERTLRLTLEYDGGAFSGWARQPERRTVEGSLADALESLWPGAGATLVVAGRTDAGVHARGQVATAVVSGGPSAARVGSALRARLPADLAVVAARDARPGFHARFAALARRYEYRVLASRVRSPLRAAHTLHQPARLDRELLEACAALVVGEHDFRAFTPAGSEIDRTRRHVVECHWRAVADELVLTIEADAFLYRMVRTLVGTMLETARGGRELASFASLLEGVPRELAGATAPPHGLMLTGVRYAGDTPGADRLRCFVVREGAAGRELLVLAAPGGEPSLPETAMLAEERVDEAALRAVEAASGAIVRALPRSLGLVCHAESRVRDLLLEAPPEIPAAWRHGAADCRFVPVADLRIEAGAAALERLRGLV
ncbi:MAG TPA: tRNA pseudouridine(38-40) synthase TruA [Gaiellales bacterium]